MKYDYYAMFSTPYTNMLHPRSHLSAKAWHIFDKWYSWFFTVKGDVKNAETHYFLGNLSEDSNDYDKAIYHYQEAIKLYPNQIEGNFRLGKILFERKNNFVNADRCFLTVIDIDPSFVKAYVELGNIQMYGYQDISKAKYYYYEALKIDSNCHGALTNLVKAYVALGNIQITEYVNISKAKYYYNKALKIDPNCNEALTNLKNISQFSSNYIFIPNCIFTYMISNVFEFLLSLSPSLSPSLLLVIPLYLIKLCKSCKNHFILSLNKINERIFTPRVNDIPNRMTDDKEPPEEDCNNKSRKKRKTHTTQNKSPIYTHSYRVDQACSTAAANRKNKENKDEESKRLQDICQRHNEAQQEIIRERNENFLKKIEHDAKIQKNKKRRVSRKHTMSAG